MVWVGEVTPTERVGSPGGLCEVEWGEEVYKKQQLGKGSLPLPSALPSVTQGTAWDI